MKIDATIFIFIILLGFILTNSKWFNEQLKMVTDALSSGIQEARVTNL